MWPPYLQWWQSPCWLHQESLFPHWWGTPHLTTDREDKSYNIVTWKNPNTTTKGTMTTDQGWWLEVNWESGCGQDWIRLAVLTWEPNDLRLTWDFFNWMIRCHLCSTEATTKYLCPMLESGALKRLKRSQRQLEYCMFKKTEQVGSAFFPLAVESDLFA